MTPVTADIVHHDTAGAVGAVAVAPVAVAPVAVAPVVASAPAELGVRATLGSRCLPAHMV